MRRAPRFPLPVSFLAAVANLLPLLFGIALVGSGPRWIAAQTPAPPAPLPPGAAAVVNGQVISQKLVETFLRNGQEALNLSPATEAGRAQLARLREGVIDELIERALIAQGVAERGLTPTEAQLDAAEANVQEFWGDETRYAEFLKQNGLSPQEYRDVILRSAANGEALSAALAKEIAISDEEIKAHYEAHLPEPDFQSPERVTAAHILFDTRPGILTEQLRLERKLSPGPEMDKAVAEETERRRRLAEDVRRRAAEPGADFAALARQYSDDFGTREKGGSLATFARGTHPLALDDVLFALKPGEVGPAVVKTEFGFHVVKTIDHRPAGPRTLADTTLEIRRRLTRARLAQQTREWLQQARAKAAISISPVEPASAPARVGQ